MHHPAALSPDASDGGIEIRATAAGVGGIYGICVQECRENLGKYIFLITVSEVNAAYLGVPTGRVI